MLYPDINVWPCNPLYPDQVDLPTSPEDLWFEVAHMDPRTYVLAMYETGQVERSTFLPPPTKVSQREFAALMSEES